MTMQERGQMVGIGDSTLYQGPAARNQAYLNHCKKLGIPT